MPKFKVGDRVERIGSLVPEWMHSGVILQSFQMIRAKTCLTSTKSISVTK
jgi:hypothetical protein